MHHEIFGESNNNGNKKTNHQQPCPEKVKTNVDLYYKKTKLLFPKSKNDFKVFFDQLDFTQDYSTNKLNVIIHYNKHI